MTTKKSLLVCVCWIGPPPGPAICTKDLIWTILPISAASGSRGPTLSSLNCCSSSKTKGPSFSAKRLNDNPDLSIPLMPARFVFRFLAAILLGIALFAPFLPGRRAAAARVGKRANPQRRQGVAACHAHALREPCPSPRGQAAGITLRALTQRGLEFSLGAPARATTRGLLQTGLRRERLESYPGAVLLADAGLWRAGVHQFYVSLQERPAACDERAAAGLHRLREPRPGGQLPA